MAKKCVNGLPGSFDRAARAAGGWAAARGAALAAAFVVSAGCGGEPLAADAAALEGARPLGADEEVTVVEVEAPPLTTPTDFAPTLGQCTQWRYPNEWQHQGVTLHGVLGPPDEVPRELPRTFSLTGAMDREGQPLGDFYVEDRHLVVASAGRAAVGDDPWEGVTLRATITCVAPYAALAAVARIRRRVVDPQEPGESRYAVEIRDNMGSGWVDACRNDDGTTGLAVPFAGVWDAQGSFHPSTDAFTFACETSTIVKCDRMGYRHWVASNETPDARQPLHLACTRMMRADYCGDGLSHTRNGTLIDVWDDAGILSPRKEDGLFFEAAWLPEGASCMHHPRWSDRAPPCFYDIDEIDRCESEIEAQDPGSTAPLLFNESAMN